MAKLPSDELIVSIEEDRNGYRIYHAILLNSPDEIDVDPSTPSLCGQWTVAQNGLGHFSRSRGKRWGEGGLFYSDQKYCEDCRLRLPEVRRQIDGSVLRELAVGRRGKGTGSRPRPPSYQNSFAAKYKAHSRLWVRALDFPTLGPEDVYSSTDIDVEWRCKAPGHSNYIDQVKNVTARLKAKKKPCPFCRIGLKKQAWTKGRIIAFVRSIAKHLDKLSPADRYQLLLQTGMLSSSGSWSEPIANIILNGDTNELGSSGGLQELVSQVEDSDRAIASIRRELRHLGRSSNWSDKQDEAKFMALLKKRAGKTIKEAMSLWCHKHKTEEQLSALKAYAKPDWMDGELLHEELDILWRKTPSVSDGTGDEDHFRTLLVKAFPSISFDTSAINPARYSEDVLSEINVQVGTALVEDSDEQFSQPKSQGTHLSSDNVKELLDLADNILIAEHDEEAIEYFLSSQVNKLWSIAYNEPKQALEKASSWQGGEFGNAVRDRFLSELSQVEQLEVPDDWEFRPQGISPETPPFPPRIMQKLTAVRVLNTKDHGVGNWSIMGGGKTLSAILTSAIIESSLTVVICPNATVEGWCSEIYRVFPNANVSKSWKPPEEARRRFIVLNIEQFQLKDTPSRVSSLIEQEFPGLVVLDEVHKFKQRDKQLTKRREMLLAFLSQASELGAKYKILALTGTPVINNLFETRSLIELCTLTRHEDLETKPTLPNAMRIYSRLSRLGLRYRPDYLSEFEGIDRVMIDVSEHLTELIQAGSRYEADLILLRTKESHICSLCTPKTVIYSELVEGVHLELSKAINKRGFTTGFYNGNDKSGLLQFLNGQVDCLIASSTLGTGVDGLQYVTDRLIIATLPWTSSDFDQLLGRFFRPLSDGAIGQVKVQVPWTYIPANRTGSSKEWSLDGARWKRIMYKSSLADTAVDGVLPKGELRTPEQAFSDLQEWLQRIENEPDATSKHDRKAIHVPLPLSDSKKIQAKVGDLTRFHAKVASSNSRTTHELLQDAPEEWAWYHTEVESTSESWSFRPVERCIEWLQPRIERNPALIIADLGCGLAKIQRELGSKSSVLSFDHVAVSEDINVANIAEKVPLEDESVDVVVLSLVADWQRDWEGCIRESARILALDGRLLLWETSSFIERVGGVEALEQLLNKYRLHTQKRQIEQFIGIVAIKD